jgi:uncharacterized protein YjbI with pentapeptide repeats
MSSANMVGAIARSTNFQNAELLIIDADRSLLLGADFSRAKLGGAHLKGSSFANACFFGTEFGLDEAVGTAESLPAKLL